MKMEQLHTNKGSLLLEICLALAFFTVVVSFTSLSLSSLTMTATSLEKARMTFYKNIEILENAVALEQTTPHSKHDTSVYQKDLTQCRKLLSVNELVMLVINNNYNEAVGYDCGGTEPTSNSFALKDTSISLGTTTAFDVYKNKIFVVASSTDSTAPSFYILDTLASPISLISSLNTGRGVNALDATKKYTYLAAKGTKNQFQIINTEDGVNPRLMSEISLPGVAGSYPSAISIFYYNSKVYVGTHRTAGKEFHVFDVSNPSMPLWLGALEINHNINAISVRGDYAYLATSGNTNDIIILNISNPTRITTASLVSFLGNEDTWTLYLRGNILYAGRAKSTQATHPEIVVLNIEDINNPTIVGALRFNAKVNSVKVSGDYLFTSLIGSKTGLYSLPISSIASTTPTIIAPSKTSFIDIDYEEGILYSLSQDGSVARYKQ